MKPYNTKCFGISNQSGNPALIVENDHQDVNSRLSFAQTQNKTCVFVDHIDNLYKLDYYYPHARSPLCLHGTLAFGYIFFQQHPTMSKVTINTNISNQKITIEKQGSDIFIIVAQQLHSSLPDFHPNNIRQLLNLDRNLAILDWYVASCGSPKLFVEVQNIQILNALQPDLIAIYAMSKQNHISGIYVYCQLAENIYSGRNFNHTNPQLEDAATGIAATAITCHLKHDLTIYQGEILGNHCVMYTKFFNDCAKLGGRVVLL